jgi:hypothetical protein
LIEETYVGPTVDGDAFPLAVTDDAKAPLVHANSAGKAILRDRIQQKQQFRRFTISSSIGGVLRIPNELADGVCRWCCSFQDFGDCNPYYYSLQIRKLGVRLNTGRDDIPADNCSGALNQVGKISASGLRSSLCVRERAKREQKENR